MKEGDTDSQFMKHPFSLLSELIADLLGRGRLSPGDDLVDPGRFRCDQLTGPSVTKTSTQSRGSVIPHREPSTMSKRFSLACSRKDAHSIGAKRTVFPVISLNSDARNWAMV